MFTHYDVFIDEQDTATLGGASMLTEWGECDAREEDGAIECDNVQSGADKHFQGWAWYVCKHHVRFQSVCV